MFQTALVSLRGTFTSQPSTHTYTHTTEILSIYFILQTLALSISILFYSILFYSILFLVFNNLKKFLAPDYSTRYRAPDGEGSWSEGNRPVVSASFDPRPNGSFLFLGVPSAFPPTASAILLNSSPQGGPSPHWPWFLRLLALGEWLSSLLDSELTEGRDSDGLFSPVSKVENGLKGSAFSPLARCSPDALCNLFLPSLLPHLC